MSKAVFIDGHSILNRAFYGLPVLTNTQGVHTNAVLGFLNIMFKVMDEEKPDYLAVAFDVHAPTFRHEMYKEYKGTRSPMPEELREQVPLIKEVLKAMNICILEKAGYEADDILGTLSRIFEARGDEVSVISGDRDLLQLATDKVKIRIPKTKKTGTEVEDYNTAQVIEKYGVTPSEFIDVKALMGDASDNIPGVPGIGEKTAGKIIAAWHSIEEAHEHLSEIKPKKASQNLEEFYEKALFSKILVTIKTDCELEFKAEDALIYNMMNENSYEILKQLELKNILSRFDKISKIATSDHKSALIIDDPALVNRIPQLVSSDDTLGLAYIFEDGIEGLAIAGINMNGPVKADIIEKSGNVEEGKASDESEDMEDGQNGEKTGSMEDGQNGGESGNVYFIPVSEDISGDCLRKLAVEAIRKSKCTWTDDLKTQLQWLELNDKDPVFDASIAAYLLNPLADHYDYDSISQNYLKETLPSREELLGKISLGQVWQETREKVLEYLAYRVLVPMRAGQVLLDKLEESQMAKLFYEIEMPVLYVLSDMEKSGVRAEKKELEDYGKQLVGRIDELEQNIYDLAGESFNINSPKQLGVILFEKMNLPFAKKTKTGYSTSADVLEKLRGKDPIIGQILEYRQLTKLKSTYADGLVNFINPDDQRIHCKFNQSITATGRLSCTDPNLQNIPVRVELGRMIRKVFVPEEGRIFVNADYSQIELRVLAHMAGDQALINAYKENMDIHRITASKVFHIPFEEVTSQQRRSAKAVNFGIVYGISSFGLSQDLDITKKEAEGYIKKYFETYPGIKEFLDRAVEEAKEKGYSITLYGRRRPVPELASKNFVQRGFGERVAMNSPIQGTAADIIKIAMVNVSRRMKEEKLKSKLILQIHDELLIEAVPEEAEEVKKILSEEMCNAVSLKVPLEVDMNTGNNWYELK